MTSYKSFFDFANRIDLGAVNKAKLESLVYAGAFDFTHQNRATLLLAVDQILEYKDELKRYKSKLETYEKKVLAFEQRELDIQAGKLSDKNKPLKPLKLLDKPALPVKPDHIIIPEMSLQEVLSKEKELTGAFISGHPLDKVKHEHTHTIAELREDREQPEHVSLVVIISEIQLKETKKDKKRMAFLKFEDLTGTVDGTIFSNGYLKYADILLKNIPLLVVAKVDYIDIENDDGDITSIPSLIIQSVKLLGMDQGAFRESFVDIPLNLQSVLALKKTLDKVSNGDEMLRLNFTTKSDTVLSVLNLTGVSSERTFRTIFYKNTRE